MGVVCDMPPLLTAGSAYKPDVRSKEKKYRHQVHPIKDKNFTVEIIRDMTKAEGSCLHRKRGKAQCISCGNTISYETMTEDIAKNKDREMIAIQVQKQKGRDYITPTKKDRNNT